MGCAIEGFGLQSENQVSGHKNGHRKCAAGKVVPGKTLLSVKLDAISRHSETMSKKKKILKWIQQIPSRVGNGWNTNELHKNSMCALEKIQRVDERLRESKSHSHHDSKSASDESSTLKG
ncbi:unnamed protein product [Phytomonas sp. EM1]|nr:unnamed protein product [Phytomonas sp. EM1]|eukprot:CCW62647.1 unnamed protein product [Phytomonas sp. isolate EM1]